MKFIQLTAFVIFTTFGFNQADLEDSIPTHQTFTIESKYVGETRVINVWTPPTYFAPIIGGSENFRAFIG